MLLIEEDQKEAFLAADEREKLLTEKYAVKKEENDGERRSRPRKAPTASRATFIPSK